MGLVEIDGELVIIHSHIITYGNAADPLVTETIRAEIEDMWNEPAVGIRLGKKMHRLRFRVSASFRPATSPIEIYQNLDPRNNYFRVEEFALGNISFVDGTGCNSGYFKLENLYPGSTTAAHEYGHTLGLAHPNQLDIRGRGRPGIMYPRGTLVDPQYQYEPDKPAGAKGGTLNPVHRRVLPADVEALKIHRLRFQNGKAMLGNFTNLWHADHAQVETDG